MGNLIGKPAPDFKAAAVVGKQIVQDFTLSQYQGKYVVFFFYPLDFTFVCPTELHAFQDRMKDFQARETQVIACSVDSVYSHQAWINTPKLKGGIEGVEYPLVSDLNKTIAHDYDVLVPGKGICYRGLFLIDKKGIVHYQVINDLALGRSVDEVLRMVDALAFHETYGEVCPANWQKGQKTMKPTQEGVEQYFSASQKN